MAFRTKKHQISMWLYKAVGGALLAAAMAFLANDYLATRRSRPPSRNCTLVELVERVPAPFRLAIVARSGEERLVWIGTIPRFTVRSGPPCYIFDRNGLMVDWCPEAGEGWSSDYLEVAAFHEDPIPLSEALRWCAEGKRK
jgi:hypothetical protein